jgi:type IV secretion system protein VirD4
VSSPAPRPVNDHLLNLGIGLMVAGFAFTLVLRGAGTVTAWLTGLPLPGSGITAGVGVLASPLDPGEPLGVPGLNPVLYWMVAALMLALVLVPGVGEEGADVSTLLDAR